MSRGATSRSFSGPANPETVAQMRATLREWLADTVVADDERVCAIVLAASEALSNSAEHAYRAHAAAGSMTLSLIYDPARAVVEIITSDHGRWIEPDSDSAASNFRGRGLPLLRSLADGCDVDGHDRGTTVRMQFHDCPAREQASAEAG